METKINSFIEAAITRVSAQNSSFGAAALLVEDRNDPHWSNRIAGAWAGLIAERNQLRVLDLEDAGTRVKDMPVKPEVFLSLCQNLLNQSCWAARQYIRAYNQNQIEETLHGVNGLDFSQDVADELGIEPINVTEIEEVLLTDLAIMENVHSFLSTHMNYLQDIDDLHLFVERQQEGEVWRITAVADNFSDAEDLMDAAVVRMSERADAELTSDALTTDFTEAA